MKTLLLNISDIHAGSDKAENEGLVLSKFIIDVKEQISKMSYDELYVLIGGDLVSSATEENYALFDKQIIQRLVDILNIEREHFIITPGNHDLKQSYIGEVKESFLPIFGAFYGEKDFNDLIRKEAQKSTIFGKFEPYKNYIQNSMKLPKQSLTCSCYSLNDKWSVHTLNTAVLSVGGFDKISDNGHMGVDTRSLQEHLQEDNHPNKILLMHHPEYFCMDWVKHELKKLYKSDFTLILSGHTHDQDCFCSVNKRNNYIRCEAPQLFTDKYDDTLGYNFIELQDSGVSRIIYREWVEKKNSFGTGRSFTDDESGICEFELNDTALSPSDDLVLSKLKDKLRFAMNAFIGQPYIWVERYLSDDRIDQVFKLTKSTMFSENDIINMGENIRIVAPSLYGLTCYGLHFLITSWFAKRQFGIYVNADGVRSNRFENLVNRELELFNKTKDEVKWLVIDNWRPYKKDQQGISKYIQEEFPEAHVVLMSPYSELDFSSHVNTKEVLDISKTLYLTPLKRSQERLIVDEYNKSKYIDESDVVLRKLDEDIKNFNLHRTPYNCLTLMTVFRDSFDKNPVNRTAVLESILNIIFDNTKLPNYKDSNPDVKDCEFCLGYFCSQIIDNEYYFFTWDYFYSTIKSFCEAKKTEIDIKHLFDLLCYNSIIIKESSQYTFHFTFWVYYFTASWMHIDSDFASRMLKNQKYQHYPEVLEFYTGKDRKRKDAVETVTEDLRRASETVQNKAGFSDKSNPFAFLRFKNDTAQTERIIKEIDSNIQKSNLPQSLKDQAADMKFNPSAAFNQEINKVYTNFSVGYLVNLITISCKVLRNSDHLDADVKQNLLSEITKALKAFSNIIFLVSHLFAKQGFIHLPEYNLKLTEGFDGLTDDEKRIRIIASIPYNLMQMYKEDLYSRKLSPVYISQLKEEKDKAEKHLLASFIAYKQPEGWEPALRSYIDQVGQDSYYLGTLIEAMSDAYYTGELELADRMRMNNLLKSALYKNEHGTLPPSLNSIYKLRLTHEKKVIRSAKIKTAVILAAGMGTRFGKYTELIPKGFVEYKEKPMVIRSIETLIDCGIERIIIGTGYHKEKYEALMEKYPQIQCVFSPRYAETNSMYTLWNCRETIGDDDFLLLESDLVFERRAIQELIDCKFDSAMLITPVTKFQDQYYVQMDEKCQLINCSTDKEAIQPSGELVGIHKLSNKFYKTIITEYNKVINEKPKLGYEFQLLLTSQKGVGGEIKENAIMNVLKLEGLQWYEIDDPDDLSWAEQNIKID